MEHLKLSGDTTTILHHDVQCPYCHAGQDVDFNAEIDGYEELEIKQRCSRCEREFEVEVIISVDYVASALDCVEHDWEVDHEFGAGSPFSLSLRRCRICDQEEYFKI